MPDPVSTIKLFRNEKNFETFDAGQTIFSQGDTGLAMHAVVDGDVDLVVNGTVVETVPPGGIFGEMAIVDMQTRSASAIAKTDCKITSIDKRKFSFLVQESPFFAIQVMRIMAERLRNMNSHLNSSKDS